MCGVKGYNYSGYGFKAEEMDQGARDFAMVIRKLHAKRCALFVEQYEGILGFAVIGQVVLNDQPGSAAIPGCRPDCFIWGFHAASRRAKRSRR